MTTRPTTRISLGGAWLDAVVALPRTHALEQVLRVVLGASLVICSPFMWSAAVFRLLGWAIVVSSTGLMLVPRQWHHRFGKRVLPLLIRHIRLYAIGTFAFGASILYAVLGPQLQVQVRDPAQVGSWGVNV